MTTRKRARRRWNKRRSEATVQLDKVIVDPAAAPSVITVMAYGPDQFVERCVDHPQDICELVGKYPVTWVDVEGLGNGDHILQIAKLFGLHQLALEDVVRVHQRAKVEQYGEHLFIVARMVELNDHLDTEQVSIFLGENFVLTFQERPGEDSIQPVRERLRQGRGRIRSMGADYLMYAVLDAVIDGYFPVLERYGERLEDLEDEVTLNINEGTIARIHDVKTDLLTIRRAIWPHREAINALVRDPSSVVHDETRIYLRDCYDHTVQLIDMVETYREMGADLRDLYLSSISNRMNEVMKVLTVIATIFIPLTFIVGVYGMNFENMPELKWRYGYILVWVLMIVVTAVEVFFFYRNGWIGPPAKTASQDHNPALHHGHHEPPASS